MSKRWFLMLSKILCGVLSALMIGGLSACGRKEEVSHKEQAKVGVSYLFDTNYLYHMLSVAKCGYDNDYSKKYRSYHDEKDLAILKENERFITIKGGEYKGELLDIALAPACFQGRLSAKDYFKALMDGEISTYAHKNSEGADDETDEFLSTIQEKIEALNEENQEKLKLIAKVFYDNYDIYYEKIWPQSEKELIETKKKIEAYWKQQDFVNKWEELTGYQYDENGFVIELVNGIEGGVEAIIIGNHDLFSIPTEANWDYEIHLMCHELGMFLLLQNLFGEDINDNEKYMAMESLVEFYTLQIIQDSTTSMFDEQIIKEYQKMQEEHPDWGAEKLYKAYLEKAL